MEKDWVVAYSTNQIYQAEILKEVLSDHDIESIIINKQDSVYKFGDVEVYVKRDQILKAKKLVQEFES
ncbi:MAG: DUF2007 domain-containing protein [Deltaproteobacteria bacterium]|nr:DUF2007 domain-containing protein [Deltaproteobacteria bacterium]